MKRDMKEQWYADTRRDNGQWAWFYDFRKPIPIIGEIWNEHIGMKNIGEKPGDPRR
jgi:hypothetical protein